MQFYLKIYLSVATLLFIINAKDCYAQSDTVQSGKFLREGILKYNAENYAGAIIDFESSIKYDSKNWNAYRYKADAESGLSKYKEAITDYTYALSINWNDGLSYLGRAEAKRFTSDFKSAIEDYTIALKGYPNDELIYFGRANCYREVHNYEEAVNDYTKFIERVQDYSTVYLQRGMAFYELYKYRQAINDFNNYVRLSKDPTPCYYYRGSSYGLLGKSDSAIVDLENYFKKYPKWSDGLRVLGAIYADNGNKGMARKYFQESLDLDSNNLYTCFFWGNNEISWGDNMQKGKALITKAYLGVKNPAKELCFYMGAAEAFTGDTINALKHFNEALKTDENYQDVYYTRIDFLSGSDKYSAQVIKDLTKLISFSKDVSTTCQLYAARGWLNGRQKNYIIAMQDIDKAISSCPEEPLNYLYKAWMMFTISQAEYSKDKILAEVDKAIKLNDKLWEAYLIRGYIYHVLDERERACVNFKMAIKLGANISQEQEEYLCKGKLPKDGIIPDITFYVAPKIKSKKMKHIQQKK